MVNTDTLTIIPKIAESKSANNMQIALLQDSAPGGGNTPIILHSHRITSERFKICDTWGGTNQTIVSIMEHDPMHGGLVLTEKQDTQKARQMDRDGEKRQ